MKKMIVLITIVCVMLCGCNDVTKMGTDEVITKFSFRYDVDESKQQDTYYNLEIDFSKEKVSMEVEKMTGKKIPYKINDMDKLTDYLRELVSHPDNQDKKSYMESPPQKVIWSFEVKTDANSYKKIGFDDYPGYWNELWEILIDSTDAETLEDFGFGATDKYDFDLEYSLTESSVVENLEGISKNIKFPQLTNAEDLFLMNKLF